MQGDNSDMEENLEHTHTHTPHTQTFKHCLLGRKLLPCLAVGLHLASRSWDMRVREEGRWLLGHLLLSIFRERTECGCLERPISAT